MKNENKEQQMKTQTEERPYTFKIIKKRSPWNSNEDEAIIELVNKHGTGNWTLIANEMSSIYDFKNRSGKQCRERWHNHLDPEVNKEYWSEKEESVLFNKHLEYGNKWSDIAKYLPGRTDNAIKNHFYSKLRKLIRKILKQINKENLIKLNGIDSNKYNSDKIYKMLKKFKIAYKNLNKDTIINLIINQEKSSKGNKNEGHNGQMLKKKTKRTRNTQSKSVSKPKLSINTKIHSRNNSARNNNNQLYSLFLSKSQKKKKKTKRRKVSICLSTPENKKSQINKIFSRRRTTTERNQIRVIHISSNNDNIDDDNDIEDSDTKQNTQLIDFVRPGLEIHNQTTIVIDKNLLYIQYPQITITKPDNKVEYLQHRKLPELTFSYLDNVNPNPTPHLTGFIDDNKMLTYIDSLPQISPMNMSNMILFPPSTRNMFNLDITTYDNFIKNGTHPSFSMTPKHNIPTNLISPSNKEIALHNKILINELKSKDDEYLAIKEDKSNDNSVVHSSTKKLPQIDLSLINQSDQNTFLLESLGTLRNNTTNIFNLSPVSAFIPKLMNDHHD